PPRNAGGDNPPDSCGSNQSVASCGIPRSEQAGFPQYPNERCNQGDGAFLGLRQTAIHCEVPEKCGNSPRLCQGQRQELLDQHGEPGREAEGAQHCYDRHGWSNTSRPVLISRRSKGECAQPRESDW